ncbi:MAG: Fic family protein [Deltaproteobacteria bacterium]|nr:Fic family protein [Deltaproteobacteria bacterium]
MKERYQELDDKNEKLQFFVEDSGQRGESFMQRFEMAWIFHDNALEGTVYTEPELSAALGPQASAAEASMLPVVFEIRNHKIVCDFVRAEATAGTRKQAQVTLTLIKRIHDMLSGSTAEAQAARAQFGLREKTDREKEKDKEKAGYRKDMPLHRTYFHDIHQPSKIPGALEKLVDFTSTAEFREMHPIQQSAHFQHTFMQIFPFTEHSGRVARMCSNMVLVRAGYMPAIIHSIDRQKYYESLRGPVANFRGLLMDAMENSLDNGLKYFKDQARRIRPGR